MDKNPMQRPPDVDRLFESLGVEIPYQRFDAPALAVEAAPAMAPLPEQTPAADVREQGDAFVEAPLMVADNVVGFKSAAYVLEGMRDKGERMPDTDRGQASMPPVLGNVAVNHFAMLNKLRRHGGSAPEAPLIIVASPVGGSGKSVLAASLAYVLSRDGERCLMADNNPASHLALFFGGDERVQNWQTDRPVPGWQVFAKRLPATNGDIGFLGFSPDCPEDVLRESAALSGLMAARVREVLQFPEERASRRTLGVLEINLPVAFWNAGLAGADVVLVPLRPDLSALLAVEAIENWRHASPGAVPAVYYVVNMYRDASPVHREVLQVMRDRLGDALVADPIPWESHIDDALADGCTITEMLPASPAAQAVECLAGWVMKQAPILAKRRGVAWR